MAEENNSEINMSSIEQPQQVSDQEPDEVESNKAPQKQYRDASTEEFHKLGQEDAEAWIREIETSVVQKYLPGEAPQNFLNEDSKKPISSDIAYREPTPEEVAEFQQALEDKIFRGMPVLGATIVAGRKGLEYILPDGKKGVYVPGSPKENVFLYFVDDPKTAELASAATIDQWLEKNLRPRERLSDVAMDGDFPSSLLATIQNVKIPGLTPQQNLVLVNKLTRKARGRIFYHNSFIQARFAAGELGGSLTSIQESEHREIFNTPGLERALIRLTNNSGLFFRVRPGERNPATGDLVINEFRENIRAELQATLGLDPEEAYVALDLAEKTAHIFGEAAYYDGLKVPPAVAAAGGLTRDGVFVPTPSLVADPDGRGFISAEVLNDLYPDPPPPAAPFPITDKFARFFEEFYDNIDIEGSMRGNGSTQLRGSFYYPIAIEKNPLNKGKASGLRKYAYLWLTSFVRYNNEAGATPRGNIIDQIGFIPGLVGDNFASDMGKIYQWAPRVAETTKNRGLFNEKGTESILVVPVNGPNQVTDRNANEIMPRVMDNFKKTVAIFLNGATSQEDREAIMGHLLKGLLLYINSPEARTIDGFNYAFWGDKKREAAMDWAQNDGLIGEFQAAEIKAALNFSELKAAAGSSGDQLETAASEFFSAIIKAITRR